jgi:hypothetical protein
MTLTISMFFVAKVVLFAILSLLLTAVMSYVIPFTERNGRIIVVGWTAMEVLLWFVVFTDFSVKFVA